MPLLHRFICSTRTGATGTPPAGVGAPDGGRCRGSGRRRPAVAVVGCRRAGLSADDWPAGLGGPHRLGRSWQRVVRLGRSAGLAGGSPPLCSPASTRQQGADDRRPATRGCTIPRSACRPRSSAPHRPSCIRQPCQRHFRRLADAAAMSRWHSAASARPTGNDGEQQRAVTTTPGRSARRNLCAAAAALAVVSGCSSAQPANPGPVPTIRRPPPAAAWRRAAVKPEVRQCRAQPRSRHRPARRRPRHRPTRMRCRPHRRPRARQSRPDEGTRHHRGESHGARGPGADAVSGGVGG